MKKAYLVLADGKVFEGEAFGAVGTVGGELTFNTGVVGYLEMMTDSVNYGRIILQTFPMLGDYGVMEEDLLGKPCIKGFAVREWCAAPSNFRCQYDIDKYMKDNGIVGICGIDTREITKIIREEGSMNAVISESLPVDPALLNADYTAGAVKAVAPEGGKTMKADKAEYKVTLVDFGAKDNLAAEFAARGCDVTTAAFDASAEEILASNPDAVILSDGPGKPEELTDVIEQIKKLNKPVFAVGLGHCLLALANGGKVEKLKYGHMGGDQPVKHIGFVRSYITSQNHMYAVYAASVAGAEETFANINDGTNEGLAYKNNSVSYAFVPVTCAGPQDEGFIFDDFIKTLGGAD